MAGNGNFTEIPTLSGVMENLMDLQNVFAASGVPMPTGLTIGPNQKLPQFQIPVMPQREIAPQPEREPDSDDDDEEEEDNSLDKDVRTIKELMGWIKQAIKTDKGSRAAKIRKALRKQLPPMRQKYHDSPLAREVCKEARAVIREVEDKFPDFIGIDTDDSDYDSEDSFFSGDEDEDEFY